MIGGVLWLAGQITGLNPFATESVENVGPTVVQSVRDLSDLTTVESVEYTTIEKGRDAGILNFFRGDKVFLFAVARVGAGIDLSQLSETSVEVDRTLHSVRIELPPAQILYVALDNEATRGLRPRRGVVHQGRQDPRERGAGRRRERAARTGVRRRHPRSRDGEREAHAHDVPQGARLRAGPIVGAQDEPTRATPAAAR